MDTPSRPRQGAVGLRQVVEGNGWPDMVGQVEVHVGVEEAPDRAEPNGPGGDLEPRLWSPRRQAGVLEQGEGPVES